MLVLCCESKPVRSLQQEATRVALHSIVAIFFALIADSHELCRLIKCTQERYALPVCSNFGRKAELGGTLEICSRLR